MIKNYEEKLFEIRNLGRKKATPRERNNNYASREKYPSEFLGFFCFYKKLASRLKEILVGKFAGVIRSQPGVNFYSRRKV